MALNLNKGDENNAKPDSEKKGLNLDKTTDSKKVSLNLTKANDAPAGSPSSSNNQGEVKKKSPMLYILVSVALLGIGVYWFINATTPPPLPPTAPPVDKPAVDNDETPVDETPVDEPFTVTAPVGTIEEKAKQVISGDFGNGANRKRALGKDYAEIQAKINEIYRAKY